MSLGGSRSLREVLIGAPSLGDRFLWGISGSANIDDLARVSRLRSRPSQLYGQSVILAIRDQLITALALIELDGAARRLILCPPDLTLEQISSLVEEADADVVISDWITSRTAVVKCVNVANDFDHTAPIADAPSQYSTEWVLLTSGTSSTPKLVLHSLASLTAAFSKAEVKDHSIVWGTFYNICRYGGLQILLRAVLGGASLVLPDIEESAGDYLSRLAQKGATHLLGTPTHWRRALMTSQASNIVPRYVRLSGEIVDQSILNALRVSYPQAVIAHAFASTEAGVAFAIDDGLEGFPESQLKDTDGDIKLDIEKGSLRISSAGTAVCYLGSGSPPLRDPENFVDTGDAVELRNGRYYFLGRISGVINIGGSKVHPEEVEALINRHPRVEISRVRAKKNPITGSLVVADIVLKSDDCQGAGFDGAAALKSEILKICGAQLSRYKVPVEVNIVSALPIGPTGKVIRHHLS
jgi:acyl-coenzyme A synthetase/AMP-(fatty) acid ligase